MTQEALRERIDAYCRRYKVSTTRGAMGLPPYPAGERETPQHRDWIVLYKAISRFRRRQAGLPGSPERVAALKSQNGICPLCLTPVGTDGENAHQPGPGATMTIVHAHCNELLRLALTLGPEVFDRVRAHAWPEPRSSMGAKRR